MPSALLATCTDLPAGDEDAALLETALDRAGVHAQWAAWGDPDVDWSDRLVVLRSTWDYTADRDAFLTWASAVPRLANGADVVAWSSDKVYLGDLATAGVPTVPSSFAAVGEELVLPDSGEFVIKPSVGAGSRGAGRFDQQARGAALAHAADLHATGRTVLVQPYLDLVDTRGETALIYFDGVFSHAIEKGAMLPAGYAHPVSGNSLFISENITARTPSDAELAVGATVLAHVRERFGVDQLYTRVDLLPGADGPVVTELELVEPSLFLQFDEHAADRLAAAIAKRG